MTIGFIGAGKVGFSLGQFFAHGGLPMTGYYSRHRDSAQEAAERTGTRQFASLEALVRASDAIFLTVPDGAISAVYEKLRQFDLTGKQLCHCSGAISAQEAFPGAEELGAELYSIHPLFPVSDKYVAWRELTGAFFCIEGVGTHLDWWAETLAGLGAQVRRLPSEGKARSLSLDLLDQWKGMEKDGKWRFTSPTHVVLAFSKDSTLALIILVAMPIITLLVLAIGRRVEPLWKISDQFCDKQNDLVRERLHGIRVIRAFNREEQEQGRIAEATRVMAEHIIEANTKMGLVAPIAIALMNLVAVAILYFGGSRMQSGISAASGGDIFAIIQYLALVANGVLMGGFAMVMLPHAKVAADRIGEIFHATGMQETAKGAEHTFRGEIALDHVTFRYEGASEAAVQNVSMHILPGQKIAVIGGTGSGKSTLVQLLLSFRLPTEGQILFDGVSASQIDRGVIRKNISCVLQKTAVYSGTCLLYTSPSPRD